MNFIKNVKIFSENVFKKAKVRLVGLGLAASMVTGCTVSTTNTDLKNESTSNKVVYEQITNNSIDNYNQKEEPQTKEQTTYNYEPTSTTTTTYTNYTTDLEEISELLDMQIKLSDEEINNIKTTINNTEVDYPDSELFKIDEALNEYNGIDKSRTSGEKFKVDSGELYKKVEENNQRYLEETKMGKYDNIGSNTLEKITKIVADNINDKIDKGYITEYNELRNILNNLKIYSASSFGFGEYGQTENLLLIDLPTIDNFQRKDTDGINYLEIVTKHECNHLLQGFYNEKYEGYGMCYKFNDLDINPLYSKWLFEASAEKLVLNDYDDKMESINYADFVKNLDSLTLSIILKDEVNENSIASLMFQRDIDELFKLFGAETLEQKKEIIKMLYSIELNSYTYTDFKESCEKYNNSTDYSKYAELLKGSICTTLAKTFYKNLADTLDDIKVSDMYSLISLYENDLSRMSWYSSKYNEYTTFIEDYNDIQNDLFTVVADNLNIDTDYLIEGYNLYHNKDNTYKNINCLSEEKNKYLNEMFDTRLQNKRDSINEVSRKLENSKSY